MMMETPEVSREARGVIQRARTPTLAMWFHELNIGNSPKRLVEFGDPDIGNRRRQLMDEIACELGYRYMRELLRGD